MAKDQKNDGHIPIDVSSVINVEDADSAANRVTNNLNNILKSDQNEQHQSNRRG